MVNPYIRNFLGAANDYFITTCDAAGWFLGTGTEHQILRKVGINPESFVPLGMDYLKGHNEINENSKPGEFDGAVVGIIGGVVTNIMTLGLVPAVLLVYDVGRSITRKNYSKR